MNAEREWRIRMDYSSYHLRSYFAPEPWEWDFIDWYADMLLAGPSRCGCRREIEYPTLRLHVLGFNRRAHWNALRQATLSFYGGRCYMCNGHATDVHHVLPRRYGGTDHPLNVVPLCKSCHIKVHQRMSLAIGNGADPMAEQF